MAHKEAHGKGQEHGMTLTEDEAKTKRCQESFAAAEGLSIGGFAEAAPFPPNVVSYNATASYARQTAPSHCIGSACMAWRWRFPHSANEHDKLLGYCGKAGQP